MGMHGSATYKIQLQREGGDTLLILGRCRERETERERETDRQTDRQRE